MPPSPVARLLREQKLLLNEISNGTIKGVTVAPDPVTALRWHFCFTDFDSKSDFHGGCYHGYITYPNNYPYAPPNIKFVTPNGRFTPLASICLSMSDFHPETWNPAWNMVTILLGVRSFMEENHTGNFIGCEQDSIAKRRRLAAESWLRNSQNPEFRSAFPQFVRECTPKAIE